MKGKRNNASRNNRNKSIMGVLGVVEMKKEESKLCERCYKVFTWRRVHGKPFCSECRASYPVKIVPNTTLTGKQKYDKSGRALYKRVPYTKEEFLTWLAGFERSNYYL